MVVDRYLQAIEVKPFKKKSSWIKGWSIYAKQRNILKEIYSSQRNIQYYSIHHRDFQSSLEIYLPRLNRTTKIYDFYQSWHR